jgi:diacylglycerol kinase family enzyme
VEDRGVGKPAALRRLSALLALVAFGLALVVVGAVLLRNLLVLPLVAVGLVLAVVTGWTALVCRGPRRWIFGLVAVVALAATLLLLGLQTLVGMVVLVALVALSGAAARVALVRDGAPLTGVSGRRVGPARHGVLLANPRSGGGKVGRFGLVEKARRLGVRTVLIGPGDDLRAITEQAVAQGADVLGVAGGDGSQALVADVASSHDLGFVCIPAGTRNHFALDLGLDRRDVAAALDAFGEAVERRVDLASIGGRVFVNNASLGAYATVVQSPAYRDAKLATVASMLPDLVGPEASSPDLRYTGPDGQPRESADVLLVSNNPYALRPASGLGARPQLDGGVLGIVAVRAEHSPVPRALERAAAEGRVPPLSQWTATAFRVDSSGPVPVGLDGEALRIAPPLEFRTLPGALRVRLPVTAARASQTTIRPPGVRRTVVALLRVFAGRPVSPTWR